MGLSPLLFQALFFAARSLKTPPTAITAERLSSTIAGRDTLGRRLLSLVHPKRSAVPVLHRWSEQGKPVQKYQLNRVVRDLRKHGRHKHALEICEWMVQQEGLKLQPGDYAIHVDLIAKVRGLPSAEKFFEDLPYRIKRQQSTCNALLHCYVQSREIQKAESLFAEMSKNNLINCAVSYNSMLHLYTATGQGEKVPEIVCELKRHVAPDVLTYNLWLASLVDAESSTKVFEEMRQRRISPDWVTFSTLAKAFAAGGLLQKTRWALGEMEENIFKKDRPGYRSLITLYAGVSDKESVFRVWDKMKSSYRKLSDAEYTCMISSLFKLGDDDEAERLYEEWESVSSSSDLKTANKVLDSLVKKGCMEKVGAFWQRLLKKGIKPSYNTWCILARGHLGEEKLDLVLDCMKKALASVSKWEPDEGLVKAVFDKLEGLGHVEGAEEFLIMLRDAGYVSTGAYNSVLRTYAKGERMPLVILERMEKDGVHPNEETRELIRTTSRLCVGRVSALVHE
ncbi:pentatricopeptide repeat (PPR) superfamily protein [Wolffia australiana]